MFQSPEGTAMRPFLRRKYGTPYEYKRNGGPSEEAAMAEAVERAKAHNKPATVGRLWFQDGSYRWAIRFDAAAKVFRDGTAFEPVHVVRGI